MKIINKIKSILFKQKKCERCEELLDVIESLYTLSTNSPIDCGRDKLYEILKKYERLK